MGSKIKSSLAAIMFVLGVGVCVWPPRALLGQRQVRGPDPLARWRAHDYAGTGYVGNSTCAECHKQEATTQATTPMFHALEAVADCAVLSRHTQLTFRNGAYTYQITRQGAQSIYTVTDGTDTISEALVYCFGQGMVGQTYVFRHNGALYESRVSYYQAIQGLDFTVGQTHQASGSLEEALGRPISQSEAKSCFGCHAPTAVNGTQLQLDHFAPGVTCEGCHGAGAQHVAAARAKNPDEAQIFNPRVLNANELSQDFCGSCHLNYEQAMLLPEQGGLNNIRFQAYRIFNSSGHNKVDARISCTACHNPHEGLQREAAFYDAKCLACHLSSPQTTRRAPSMASACPVSRHDCVTCHMPKVELPGMHAKFTDHWIRVVKPDEPVPH
jgi:Cytochrome c3